MIHKAGEAMRDLKGRTARKIRDAQEYLDAFLNAIANETRLMGAMRYLRRSERSKAINVYEDVIQLVENVYKQEIKKSNIEYTVSGKDFHIKIPRSSLVQVVENIFANAIYWLKLKTVEKDRKMFVELDPSKRSILIGNNGPEIAKHIERHLFNRPFVCTKPDGHGLGMYIAGRIIERAGGSIRVVKPEKDKRVSSGVAFELLFKDQSR